MFLQNIKVKKETGHECTSQSIFRNSFFMTRRFSILDALSITIYHSVPVHWENNTLSIFMLSGSIQFSLPFQFKSNHAKKFSKQCF